MLKYSIKDYEVVQRRICEGLLDPTPLERQRITLVKKEELRVPCDRVGLETEPSSGGGNLAVLNLGREALILELTSTLM